MSRKSAAATRAKTAYKAPAPADDVAVRVPAPGEGKRGVQGYLGYLLRQAHAAVRLTMERTLADLGVTSPQFAVLTMLNAYPGLSGADVARHIRAKNPQQPILFVSGYSETEAVKRTAPEAPLLAKPFRADALHKAVRGALTPAG